MWMPEFEEVFDVMDSERGDMEAPYTDSESDNTVTDSPCILVEFVSGDIMRIKYWSASVKLAH